MPWISPERLRAPDSAADAFDDDVKFLKRIGIRTIISALELPAQRKIFERCGFRYLSLRIPDGLPPTEAQAEHLLYFYDSCPLPLVVHCEGGIGRTGTLLALILLHRGMSADAAIKAVKQAMPPALETSRQVEFVYHFEKHRRSNAQKPKS